MASVNPKDSPVESLGSANRKQAAKQAHTAVALAKFAVRGEGAAPLRMSARTPRHPVPVAAKKPNCTSNACAQSCTA